MKRHPFFVPKLEINIPENKTQVAVITDSPKFFETGDEEDTPVNDPLLFSEEWPVSSRGASPPQRMSFCLSTRVDCVRDFQETAQTSFAADWPIPSPPSTPPKEMSFCLSTKVDRKREFKDNPTEDKQPEQRSPSLGRR